MYLSKLEIFGFKSFASKIKMDFGEGISCIIGPNGAGKSNIVDAVRWVLGEQRVSSLRSDRMDNVLFNGTRLRKPIGMAEVAMTLDNKKHLLKTEFDEVVVSRRLYRSGESQYLINKTPVRLRDIMDLFVDTGIGANSYSVIELKMVESILSENANDRRELFEEAAGIVKYKIRRRSALRKLEATHNDLIRINDIIGEIEKTVNSLSRQVGKARRYLAYKEELQKTEIDLHRYRYNRFIEAIKPLTLQLQEVSQLKEASHHQITIDEALLENYKRELIKKDQEVLQLNKQMQEIDNLIAQLNQDQAVADTKIQEMTKNRERYRSEIDSYENKIKLLDEQLQQYENELHKINEEKELVAGEYHKVEEKKKQELSILQEKKNLIEKINTDFRKTVQNFSSDKEQLQQKQYQFDFYQEQLNTLGENLNSFEQTVKYLEEKIQQVSIQKEKLQGQIAGKNALLTQANKESQQLDEQRKELENQQNQLLAEIERLQSRYNFYEQIISHYEGHSKSTQFAMSNKDQINGVFGPLADVISVDEKFTWAVETVLGDALNYIIVKNVDVARDLINLVKDNKKGRITLIPLEQISAQMNSPVSSNGNITLLSELIQCEEAYQGLIDILLGDVALAENFEDAIKQSKIYPQLRFVTADGEMVNFNRELSGGYTEKKTATLIGRKDQLKKIGQDLAHVKNEFTKCDEHIRSTKVKQEQLLHHRNQLESEISDYRNQLIESDKKESQLNYEIEKQKGEQRDQKDRILKFQKDLEQLKIDIETLNQKVQNNQVVLNEKEKETIARTREYEQQSQELQYLLEEVQNWQIKVTNIENQITNRRTDIERTTEYKNELKNNIDNRNNEIVRIGDLLEQIDIDSKERQEKKITIGENRDQLEADMDSFQQDINELKTKIETVESQTKQFRRQHDSSLEKSRSLELQISENRLKAENLREYILKEYAEDVEIGIPFDDFNEQEAADRIDSLRERIKNLGPVNPLAVAEYDKEKARLDFLNKQRDDLSNAESSLKETISKINKTARKQFLDTFAAIKHNFENVFRSFFENGEGTLELEESVDPLEANVEINVRTKGKKLQTLSLLSGGEKTLTAISLLFAIYLVKPSPFCILDEVDAPLDDMNIGRFTDALQNFARNTQFIIITHNKRTMEAAQTLYGVTMEEEGVSKLVSVKFT